MPTDLEIAFPVLAPHDLATLAARGRLRTAPAGDILYAVGDTSVPFFVVLDGDIEVVDSNQAGAPAFAHIGPGQFTGEVSTLSGRAVLVTARAVRDSRLI